MDFIDPYFNYAKFYRKNDVVHDVAYRLAYDVIVYSLSSDGQFIVTRHRLAGERWTSFGVVVGLTGSTSMDNTRNEEERVRQ